MYSCWWIALTGWVGLVTAVADADSLPAGTTQIVLVVTDSWDATQGEMSRFERRNDRWEEVGSSVRVSVGHAGSAWGIGLHDPQPGLQKREGDGRSPAGMFAIGSAFGYAADAPSRLQYRAMTEFDYCIDVNESPLYNRIVDARKVGQSAVARSTEPMRRDLHVNGDQLYRLGFVIEHNPNNESTRGSCIFAHVWRSIGQATAGCTAMDDKVMKTLVSWLDVNARPTFVLLPTAEYERLKGRWHLPDVSALPHAR